MADKNGDHADLNKVENQDKRNEDYAVREGSGDNINNSVDEADRGLQTDPYPADDKTDNRENNQPEFIEKKSNESTDD